MLKKRILSVVLCLYMVASMLPSVISSAHAVTGGHTKGEAVAWAKSKIGTAEDYPGSGYGAQCVDLICFYYEYLGQTRLTGNANTYMKNVLPEGWSRYLKGESTPQPGDIVVFDAWAYEARDVGHIGIVTESDSQNYKYVDYNSCGGNYAGYTCPGGLMHDGWSVGCSGGAGKLQTKTLDQFSCVIRPDWPYQFDIQTGTLTICGTGSASLNGWTDRNGVSNNDIRSIIIKDGFTSIAENAFEGCEGLESVVIPDSVTDIGKGAFRYCTKLEKVNIPNGVTIIADRTFDGCSALENIVIPNSVTSIGEYVFIGCKSLKSIFVPNSVTSIGESSFSNCTSLVDAVLPDRLTEIQSSLFYGCSSLTNVVIPPNVTKIGGSAFYGANLSSVIIPNKVTYLGSNAFFRCDSLTTVYIPISVTSTKSSVFGYCMNLKDVYYEGTSQQWWNIQPDVGTGIFFGCANNPIVHYESSAPENPPPTNIKQIIQQLVQQILKKVLGVASIRCPVDVEISVNGQSVGQIVDNVANGVDESKIYVHVENDEKYIYFLTSDKFTINLTATGTGTMEYSVQNLDVPSWTTLDEKYFRKVELTSGKKMVSDIDYLDTELVDTPNVQLYVLGGADNSTPVKKVLPDNKGTEVPLNTPVISFDTAVDSISILPMAVGDGGMLSEIPVPTRSGYTFNGWYMLDGTKIDTNTVFTADTTVKAQWTKNSTGGDSPSNPGGSTTTPTVPSGPSYNPGGTYTPPTYSITTPSITGGKVSVSPSSASSGSTVTVTATPDTGYELASLTVSDSTGKALELTAKGNGQYSFKMPNGKVSLSAEFRLLGTNASWNNPFVDVSIGDWYYDAIRFVSENGLMNGVGNGHFSPNMNLSRAMFAQILYNKAGQPSAVGSSAFNDVPIGAWYADAVTWAAANDIVGGYGDGMFGPDDPITREQLAVMLWRYAGKPVPPNLLLNFTDADRVSGYALDALCWAVDQGIINGKGNGILDPKGFATRAETAQILKNYLVVR